MQDSKVLRLIASGNGRDCFEHPLDPARCIKVPHTARGRKESRIEARYLRFQSFFHDTRDTPYIAHYHGIDHTTRGPGWVYDRILDESSNEPSPTLADTLDDDEYGREPIVWDQAFSDFHHWLARTPLVVKDLTPSNLCAQRLQDGSIRLVVIDGIGPSAFLARWVPLSSYANRRNPVYAARRGMHGLHSLIAACVYYRERRAEQRRKRASTKSSATVSPVYLLP